MFTFCCPPTKDKQIEENSIGQKLITEEYSPRKLKIKNKNSALSDTLKNKQSSDLSQKSLPLERLNLQKKAVSSINESSENDYGVIPFFKQNGNNPKHSMIETKNSIPQNKGQLFDVEHNTQIVYFDTKKGEQFCLRYLVTKKPTAQKETKSTINFILSKKIDNSQEQQLVLVMSSKMLYQSKHMQIPNNIHAIFTNMRRQSKNNSSKQNHHLVEIIEGDPQSCIKINNFDRIIVILEGQYDVDYITNYCREIAKRYSIQQFLKIWWVFPSFMGVQQISEIIKQTLRKFIINETLENALKYLYYEIEVVKQFNLEPFLLVRNRRWKDFKQIKDKIHTKEFETQICLAMGLLMTQMTQNVLQYYKYFLQHIMADIKFLDYLKYKELLQSQKQNYFKRLLHFNLMSEEGIKALQNSTRIIEYKYDSGNHRRFMIKHSSKKKFIAAFGYQQSAHTGQNNTPSRHEWDDDLKFQDLQIRKGSWDKQENDDVPDLNLIDEKQIDELILKDLQLNIDQNQKDDKKNPQNQKPDILLKSTKEDSGSIEINIVEAHRQVSDQLKS